MSLVEARDLFCVYPGADGGVAALAGVDARHRRGRGLRRPRPERFGQDDADACDRRVRASGCRQHHGRGGRPRVALAARSRAVPRRHARLRRPALLARARGRAHGGRADRSAARAERRLRPRSTRSFPCAPRARRAARPRHRAPLRAVGWRATAHRALRGPRRSSATPDRRRADRRARRGERHRRLRPARTSWRGRRASRR